MNMQPALSGRGMTGFRPWPPILRCSPLRIGRIYKAP
jgi:hypothetical protein